MVMGLKTEEACHLKIGAKLQFSFPPTNDFEATDLEPDSIYTFNGLSADKNNLKLKGYGNQLFSIRFFSKV